MTPVKSLCKMWVDNNVITLWEMAKNRAQVLQGQHQSNLSNTHKCRKRNIDLAVSYGQAGMLGKACKILTSDGLAPNNETTWNLMLSKHPASELPSIPEITHEPVSLGSDFNILSVLRSFPKDTGAGPSGLHVQHLLDVSSTALPTPICASLREVINLLASGKAPPTVSKYLAGGNLIALNKFKEGCPPDIRPIVFGEILRRLTGKCICALIKGKGLKLFSTFTTRSCHQCRSRKEYT